MPSQTLVVLLAELVATSDRVSATSSRTQKIAELADLLEQLEPGEVEPAVAFLTGEPRQGKSGVGWATVFRLDATPSVEPTLTIADLDDAIEALKSTSGTGSVSVRNARLDELMTKATEAEASFIRRLFIGELRQGALAGVMSDAVAKAAGIPAAKVRRAAMFAGDLCRVAGVALRDGEVAVDAIGLSVLTPILPMLASTATDVADAMAGIDLASVEWKLDGARIQAHRDGDDVRLYTRNLNDVTDRLPGVVTAVRRLPSPRVVLDGEVLGTGDGDRPEDFQDTMSRFGSHAGAPGLGVWFFDVLHADGDDLVDVPLSARIEVLDRVVGSMSVPRVVTSDVDEAARFSQAALDAGHEGVMVKALSSRYEAGRRGKAWRKVKPVRTLDLVVLAVEWGSGRRQGWLSNIHLGARGDDDFVMVGKTFKGMTDELLRWQTEQFLAREVRREGHIVHVRPELVVEIALDGVQRSTRYPGGVALRFARVKRYRVDKSPAEADTIGTVRAMAGLDPT